MFLAIKEGSSKKVFEINQQMIPTIAKIITTWD